MRRRLAATMLFMLAAMGVAAAEADLTYVSDITALTDQCFVRAIKLDVVEEVDEGGEPIEALVGLLALAGGEHVVQITAEDGAVVLRVDPEMAGELVRAEWERTLVDGSLLADVSLTVTHADGSASPYQLYLMWNPFMPTVMTFCRNSYREGTITLGERETRLAIIDADTDGRYDRLDGGILLVDADGDGDLLATGDSHERFFLNEPFNIDGTTYEILEVSEDGARVRIEPSDESVPIKPPLLPGFPAPEFSAADSSDETVTLTTLRGEVVVLDFWAGWCGPCVSALPTFRQLVDEFDDRGLIVLGINLDRTVGEFDAAVAEHNIDWRQVYDGSDGPIGGLYRIEGIPMTYLIGEDGVIVARGLRGQQLIDAVADLLDVVGAGDAGG